MTNPILIPELRELISVNDAESIRNFCQQTHPGTVAELLGGMENPEIWQILHMLDVPLRVEIFSNFELAKQVELATGQNRKDMAGLLEDMPPDDRADLVNKMDDKLRDEILPLVAKAEREDIRKLASYSEGTAGALMSSDYATLGKDLTVAQALERIKQQAPTRETIYYIYVVDNQHKLIGFISLRDLILADTSKVIDELMHHEVISAKVSDDQEEVARQIEKYDLLAIPVTSSNDRLVGIITHDDAADVIRQEQQEDVEMLMAIGGRHEAGEYMKLSAISHFRNRVFWVVILGILGLVSGFIVQSFEGVLLQFTILAAFMPMLVDTGGNTGSQSATLVIRALALGEVRPKDAIRVLAKELQISIMLALVLAIVAFMRVLLLSSETGLSEGVSLLWVATVISIALGLQVISATLIGAVLPLIVAKFRRDPAVVASPALTTIVDMTGLLIFFGIARMLL